MNVSPEKTYKWTTDTWKNAQHHSASGKYKSRPQWDTTSHQSEWLKLTSQETTDVGEDAEKGQPCTLLVGMQAGVAALENIMEFPQKAKYRATLWPSNCTPRYLSKRYKHSDLKGHVHPNVYSSSVHIAKLWKKCRCPSTDEWIKKMWCIYTVEYHSAIKKNETLPFAMIWMEQEYIMLSKIEKDKYHMISFICGI